MGGGAPIIFRFLFAGWNLDIMVRAGAATLGLVEGGRKVEGIRRKETLDRENGGSWKSPGP